MLLDELASAYCAWWIGGGAGYLRVLVVISLERATFLIKHSIAIDIEKMVDAVVCGIQF